jgi:hypothetical protein
MIKGNLAYGTLKASGSFESYESSTNSNVKYARPAGSNKVIQIIDKFFNILF